MGGQEVTVDQGHVDNGPQSPEPRVRRVWIGQHRRLVEPVGDRYRTGGGGRVSHRIPPGSCSAVSCFRASMCSRGWFIDSTATSRPSRYRRTEKEPDPVPSSHTSSSSGSARPAICRRAAPWWLQKRGTCSYGRSLRPRICSATYAP